MQKIMSVGRSGKRKLKQAASKSCVRSRNNIESLSKDFRSSKSRMSGKEESLTLPETNEARDRAKLPYAVHHCVRAHISADAKVG